MLCFFKMKKCRVQYDFENVFFSIPNLTRCKSFKSKSDAFWNFQFKIMLVRKAAKMQNRSFSRIKLNQNKIFWMQTIFQNLTCPKFFNSKSNVLYFFQSKIWRFVKLFNQNLTGFEIFTPKSDALEKLSSKSDKLKIIFRNLIFILFF